MKVILDTNICIYLIKEKPPQVIQKFNQYSIGEIGVSSITVAELYYGVQKSSYKEKNLRALIQFMIPLVVADFDQEAAAHYGQIRASLVNRGEPIGSLDMLIAALALSLDVVLATNNTREFSKGMGLRIENWAKE